MFDLYAKYFYRAIDADSLKFLVFHTHTHAHAHTHTHTHIQTCTNTEGVRIASLH